MTQHAGITAERWSAFTRGQQIVQIAAEMHRATRFVDTNRSELVRAGYERVFRLVDLTVEVQRGLGIRRELLRWRSFVAGLYLSPELDPGAHRMALRALLQLDPLAAGQVAALGL